MRSLIQRTRKSSVGGFFSFLLFAVIFSNLNCDKSAIVEPESDSGNWETATLHSQGLSETMLERAIEEADRMGFINSIHIVRNGYLVSETYFNGWDENDYYNFHGATSCIMSVLVGIALRENYLDSLEQKLLDFFPEYDTPDLDPRKREITIRHLLMMNAGYDHENATYSQVYNSDNWIKATIELPLVYDIGERFRYNTFMCHLISGILTRATGMSTLAFANRFLFESLDIIVSYWERDPQGIYFGGNTLYLSPRDMARFGWLCLSGGMLNGESIVSPDWIAMCQTNYTEYEGLIWGDLENYNFGYLWWVGEIGGYEVAIDIGYAGQYLIVFPELNMVIVTTTDDQVGGGVSNYQYLSTFYLVASYILWAVQE